MKTEYKSFVWKNFRWKKPIQISNNKVFCPNFKHKSFYILFFCKWGIIFNSKTWTYPQRTFIYNKRAKQYKVTSILYDDFKGF